MLRCRRIAILGSVLLGSTAMSTADAGVPMIFVTLPSMLAALLPIIVVESLVFSRRLSLRVRDVLGTVSFANIVSTVVGCPLTWLAWIYVLILSGEPVDSLDTVQARLLAVTWHAPWLPPVGPGWMLPAAGLTLLVPFFLVSWLVEYLVVRTALEAAKPRLRSTTAIANLASYSLLAVVLLTILMLRLTAP